MLRDLLDEAYGAMRHNRRRATLTMLGMAWGIATVILLMAYGAGFGTAIEHIFDSFGSKVIGVFPGVSTQQAGGAKAGVKVRLERVDVDRLTNTVPNLKHITPEMYLRTTAVDYGARSFPLPVTGTEPPAADIRKLVPAMGRFLNQQDNQQRARVAVIGSEARTKLFSGQFPVGESIRINGVSFQVISVLEPNGEKKKQILFQFLAEALVITFAGGVAGIVFAFIVSKGIGSITLYSALAKYGEAGDIVLAINPVHLLVATFILVFVGI